MLQFLQGARGADAFAVHPMIHPPPHTTLVAWIMIEPNRFEEIVALTDKPQSGFLQIKANRNAVIQQRYLQYGPEKDKAFVNCWYLPEVQALLKKAAEKF